MTDLIIQTWPIWLWILPALIVFEVARQLIERHSPGELQDKVDAAEQFLCGSAWPVLYAVVAAMGPIAVVVFFWSGVSAVYRKVMSK